MVPAGMMGTGAMGDYVSKVLSTAPVVYWPLWETAGGTAEDLINSPLQDGTAVGVTWANDLTGPFGTPAPYFDGANDYVNVNTATLAAVLDAGGAECTIAIWAKVNSAAVWADGIIRCTYYFVDTANNAFSINKVAPANTIEQRWIGGAVNEFYADAGITTTDWMHLAMTRSEAADEIRYYRNGAFLGLDVTIGNWGSVAPWATMLIGASSLVPANVWHGWMAHAAIWDRALLGPEVFMLANP